MCKRMLLRLIALILGTIAGPNRARAQRNDQTLQIDLDGVYQANDLPAERYMPPTAPQMIRAE